MNWYKRIKTSQNSPELDSILQKWKSQGITLYVYENDSKIHVESIIVPKDQRKQGIGTAIMQEIINYADSVGKRLELTPGVKDPNHGTTSRGRLVNFYKRLGLIENKGRNKDYSTMSGMYRDPK